MLSRACAVTRQQSESEKLLTDEADYQIHAVILNLKCSNEMHDAIKLESKNDRELQKVAEYIVKGWPEKTSDCDRLAKLYYPHRADLCSFEGYIMFRDRIVIPTVLRAGVLSRIHSGHQGRERSKRLARDSVFWPHMNKDIEILVDNCGECLLQRNNPPREPLRPHPVPSRAWQKVGIDIFNFAGKSYQLIIDYFSKWIEVSLLPRNPVSQSCVAHLHEVFTRFGFPDIIFSDGDPLYTSSVFNGYCIRKSMDHDFSSARYAQSNGQSERAIQHIKNVLSKCARDNTAHRLERSIVSLS